MLMQQMANASMGGAIAAAISRAIGAGRQRRCGGAGDPRPGDRRRGRRAVQRRCFLLADR
jgi:hypothetical protein